MDDEQIWKAGIKEYHVDPSTCITQRAGVESMVGERVDEPKRGVILAKMRDKKRLVVLCDDGKLEYLDEAEIKCPHTRLAEALASHNMSDAILDTIKALCNKEWTGCAMELAENVSKTYKQHGAIKAARDAAKDVVRAVVAGD